MGGPVRVLNPALANTVNAARPRPHPRAALSIRRAAGMPWRMKLLSRPAFLFLFGFGLLTARAADTGDLQQQLADAQDRLATALRSYSLLQDDDGRLKDQVQADQTEKAALQAQVQALKKANESLRAAAAAAAQLDTVREQLRQARDEIASLAQENYQLKNELAAAKSR